MTTTQKAKHDPMADIDAAQHATIGRLLDTGDAQNADFRNLCYSAAADLFTRYVHRNPAAASLSELEALRLNLVAALEKTEAQYAPQSVTRVWQQTSLLDPVATYWPAKLHIPASKARHFRFDRKYRDVIAGAFFASSLLFLIFVLLQAADLIYVHHRPEGFQQLKDLNDSMISTEPTIRNIVRVLDLTNKKVNDLISSGDIEKISHIRENYISLEKSIPDFYSKIASMIPPGSTLIFRVAPQGDGYKILFLTEFCGAVALEHKEMVDPVRTNNSIFCRYLGIWNDDGRFL